MLLKQDMNQKRVMEEFEVTKAKKCGKDVVKWWKEVGVVNRRGCSSGFLTTMNILSNTTPTCFVNR